MNLRIACSLPIVLALSSCANNSLKNENVASVVGIASSKLNLTPVYPLTSDLRPGDIFMSVIPDIACGTEVKDGKEVLLVTKVGRIEIEKIKSALDDDAKQRLDIVEPGNKETGKLKYPTVAFPAFSYASVFGNSFGVTTGVYGLGFNTQKSSITDISFDNVISVGLPSWQFTKVIQESKIVDTLKKELECYKKGNCPSENIKTIADVLIKRAGLKCSAKFYSVNLFVINNIFMAKTVKVTFSENSTFAAVAKSHLTGLANKAAEVKDVTGAPNTPAVDSPAAGKDSSNTNTIAATIDTLVSGKTPNVSNTLGFSDAGKVTIDKEFDVPLAFGVSQIFSITGDGSAVVPSGLTTLDYKRSKAFLISE